MCGACGTGVTAPPWEAKLVRPGLAGRRALANAANAAFPNVGKRVRASTTGGYVVSGRVGGLTVAQTIDEVVDALRGTDPATPPLPLEDGDDLHATIVALSDARHRARSTTVRIDEEGLDALVHVAGGVIAVHRLAPASDVPGHR